MPNNTVTELTAERSPKGRSWGQERRLQFIDFRLRWEGRINRTDLTGFFGLSIPQASLDISRYMEIAPGNMMYDRSAKTYVTTPEFQPVYPQSSAQRYLEELLATHTGIVDPDASFIGSAPDIDWASLPLRAVDEQTVECVIRAIRENMAITILYRSVEQPEDNTQLISPHALGYDGLRWHVRAYCHQQHRFTDFVLTRIVQTFDLKPSQIDITQDHEWHRMLTLVLAPHPALTAAQQRIVEMDYDMVNGQTRFNCRQAFLRYTLQRLGLGPATGNALPTGMLILKNPEDIQPYLDEPFSEY
ncbi:WYL domain-containing protein [Musicola keenii]|uniref:WYL domain-containing protein n=1 Tax=Musicola keenii TaxID=2884250 RepID=UPI00177BD74A|nr:WYL domain-containing protein [Musicola keenii]